MNVSPLIRWAVLVTETITILFTISTRTSPATASPRFMSTLPAKCPVTAGKSPRQKDCGPAGANRNRPPCSIASPSRRTP